MGGNVSKITSDESEAIALWLKQNNPVVYPVGHSGIYDCFGNKRAGLKFRLASTAKRVRKVRNHSLMTYVQLSEHLMIDADEIMSACVKHNIEVGQ
jgi:hypothetical protein